MHPALRLNKLSFKKLMRSCTDCFGSQEVNSRTESISSTINGNSQQCHYHWHQQYQHISDGLNTLRFPFSTQSLFPNSQLSCSKKCRNISFAILKVPRYLPFIFPGLNTELSFVRWYRSRMKRVMQDDSVDEKEVENIAHAVKSPSQDKQIASKMEDSPLTTLESDHSRQSEILGSEDKEVITYRSADELTLPELSRRSFSLVPYVKRSLTLQKLVMLGVDLDKVQTVKDIPELLIKCDFNKDIRPLLQFLLNIKIPIKCLGEILTKNPLLFKESVDNLELRVGYLIHKKFKLDDIAAMAVKCSIFLLMDPHKLDEKLGFLQSTFQLTGEEVRQVALTYPKILPWRRELIADVRFHIKEYIKFDDSELKQIILKEPSLYMMNKTAIVRRFDYLHTIMSITHEQVVHWPGVLSSRDFIIKNRHMFLLSLNRAQYDPCLENYVSMKALITGSDEDFCKNVAKSDVNKFYDFCKTI